MSNYSERISRLLAENSLTLADFCKKIGLNSTTTIAKIVSENRKPSSKTIGRIINAYPNISYQWLTTGIGEMKIGSNQLSEINEDDLTVTAKQILKKLDEDRMYYSNDAATAQNIKNILEAFNTLDSKVETYAEQASISVNNKLDSIFKNYNKTYLVALDKILRIEQDLENINTFMAQAFETEKIKSKLKSKTKLKTKRNE